MIAAGLIKPIVTAGLLRGAAPAIGGPFSDLFQRLGPGVVPITDAADPLNSFIDPVGGGWITAPPAPIPVAQIDSASDEVLWDVTTRIAGLFIAGHDAEFEIEIPYKADNGVLAPVQVTFLNMSAPAGKFPLFSIAVTVGIIHVELITAEDGQPDILEAMANYAATASFLAKIAYKRSTNTLAVKIGANAVLSAVGSQPMAPNFNVFAGVGVDSGASGLFRWDKIESSLTATII